MKVFITRKIPELGLQYLREAAIEYFGMDNQKRS